MNSDDLFKDLKFHELAVLWLLKNVKAGKAAGLDGIHGIVLKNCAASLASPLTSLSSVVHIHKKMTKVQ